MEIDVEQQEVAELANKREEFGGMSSEERPKLIQLREHKKNKTTEKVNIGLTKITPLDSNLTQINNTNFGAALYIQSKIIQENQQRTSNNPKGNRKNAPAWKRILQANITQIYGKNSLLTTYLHQQNRSRHLLKRIEKIKRKYNIQEQQLSFYPSIFLPLYLFPLYLSIFLPLYISIFLPLYLSIFLPLYLSIFLSFYLSIFLPLYLSIFLSFYLSILEDRRIER